MEGNNFRHAHGGSLAPLQVSVCILTRMPLRSSFKQVADEPRASTQTKASSNSSYRKVYIRRRKGAVLLILAISTLTIGAARFASRKLSNGHSANPINVSPSSLALQTTQAPTELPIEQRYLTVSGSRGLNAERISAFRSFAKHAGLLFSVVHQGTIDMRAVHRATTMVRSTPDGAGIPMSVLAVDPLSIEPTTSPAVAGVVTQGNIVVGESAAAINGILKGDDLTLVSWSGNLVQFSVGEVQPDVTIGGAELMMSVATASTLGLDRPFSIRMSGFQTFKDFESASSEISNMARSTTSEPFRVRSSQPTPSLDDTIAQAQLKTLLGDFWIKRGTSGALQVDPSWKAQNVGVVNLPIVGSVTCNTTVARAAASALQDLVDTGLGSLIHKTDSRKFGGCFTARVTRSLTGNSGHNLSRHTWGAAIDLNPTDNPYGGPSKMDQRVIDAFHRHGFVWGGTFIVPDPMHFEYTGR